VIVARDALPGLERAVEAAVANYAQADARFKAGLGTSVELADAEALRADAEIQLALGRFELARARAALGRAIAEGL
jgi:outer membrane protein TolC